MPCVSASARRRPWPLIRTGGPAPAIKSRRAGPSKHKATGSSRPDWPSPHDVGEGAALDAEDGGPLFLRIHDQTRRQSAFVRGRQGSGWRPMSVPADALTGLIGVLLGASAISVVVASGRWQQNVSSGTSPEPGDAHDTTPTYQRGTGRVYEHPACSGVDPAPGSAMPTRTPEVSARRVRSRKGHAVTHRNVPRSACSAANVRLLNLIWLTASDARQRASSRLKRAARCSSV